ncbi:hypothetical protein P7K49_021144, partial [Saguinus oedipus]
MGQTEVMNQAPSVTGNQYRGCSGLSGLPFFSDSDALEQERAALLAYGLDLAFGAWVQLKKLAVDKEVMHEPCEAECAMKTWAITLLWLEQSPSVGAKAFCRRAGLIAMPLRKPVLLPPPCPLSGLATEHSPQGLPGIRL